jgi:PAS domain-containing protein
MPAVVPPRPAPLTDRLLQWLSRGRRQRQPSPCVDALDAMDAGVVVCDAQDRLVLGNHRYREIDGLSAHAILPGASFEDILRYGLARGQHPAADGQELSWLAERLCRHRHADQPTSRSCRNCLATAGFASRSA